mgnify:CR=1 FL=1
MNQCYDGWENDLDCWRARLRHLKWVSEYRFRLLSSQMELQGLTVLDCGSGPQFTADLLRQAGATVLTLDKYAPCDLACDLNDEFTACLAPHKFDLIMMGAVIRYIQDKAAFFKRIPGVMNPKGKIFLDEFVHNPWNDAFLQYMSMVGAMEEWPRETYTPQGEMEKLISQAKGLRLQKLFSCWPNMYLEGTYPLPMWYSMLIEKA